MQIPWNDIRGNLTEHMFAFLWKIISTNEDLTSYDM